MIKAVIFDYYRTVYIPEEKGVKHETIALLERLKNKGFLLALVSKKEQGREEELKSSGFFSLFSFVCFCEEKTARSFEDACAALDVQKEEVLIVGDRIKKEIIVGNKAGIRTVWLKKGKFAEETPACKEEQPSYTITELNQIEEIIKKI